MTRDVDDLPSRDLFRRFATNDAAGRLESRGNELPRREARRVENEPRDKTASGALATKADLQERLLDELGERNLLGGLGSEGDESTLQDAVNDFVERVLLEEELPLNEAERARLAEDLIEETIGLGPLAPLMADPAITDILVNGPEMIFVERFGRIEETDVRFRDVDHVLRVIERIAGRMGRRIDQASPMVDLRLSDGSRVNATIPPISIDYPTLSIRRFGRRRLRRKELLGFGMMSEGMLEFLDAAVGARCNVLISGGTGAGKSTLLGALAEAIPHDERIVTIEDTAELMFDQRHVVRLETRPPNVEGRGRVTARDLLINSLRMRPTRIIVGEVRGAEALDMLQAMNTGHDGSLSTIHANSTRDAVSRLETAVLMAGIDLPTRAIRDQIVSAIDLMIHVARFEDGVRRIERISEVTGLEGTTPLLQDIFRFRRSGRQGRRVLGTFAPTGIVPQVVEELEAEGVSVSRTLFQERVEDSR